MAATRLSFASDYQEGAVPQIIQRLVETNLERTAGYGFDPYSESAREKIRAACQAPDAEVYFLVGGTQANATCIDGRCVDNNDQQDAGTSGGPDAGTGQGADAADACGCRILAARSESPRGTGLFFLMLTVMLALAGRLVRRR